MRHLSLLGSLFVSGLIALGACGDGGSPAAGGRTGSNGGAKGGTGGTTGAAGGHVGAAGGHVGATGGATGAGGINGCANVPACLQFIAQCTPTGTCMSQTIVTFSPPAATLNKCYSNGVKESTTGSLSGTTIATSATTVVSLNGTFCYAYDASSGGGASGSSASLTFKNAAGAVLATVISANATTTTFSCGGQTYQVPAACTTAIASIQTGTACAGGTCP